MNLVGVLALLFAFIFAFNALQMEPENILQQIYVSIFWIKAILCIITFAVCRISSKSEEKTIKKNECETIETIKPQSI